MFIDGICPGIYVSVRCFKDTVGGSGGISFSPLASVNGL